MKKILYSFIVAVLCTCCTEKLSQSPITLESEGTKQTMTIHATIDDENTKVNLSTEGIFSWEAGDSIRVFLDEKTRNPKIFKTTESGTDVTFIGEEISKTEAQNFCAAYPYSSWWEDTNYEYYKIPKEQTYVPNGVQKNIIPMFAVSKSKETMLFKPCAAIIRFSLKVAASTPVKLSKIELLGMPDGITARKIIGTSYYSPSLFNTIYNQDQIRGAYIINASNTLTVNFPEDTYLNNTSYTQINAVIIPVSLDGLNVRVYAENGDMYELKKTTRMVVKSGVVYDLGNITLKNVASSDIYAYVDGNTTDKHYLSSSFTFKNRIEFHTDNPSAMLTKNDVMSTQARSFIGTNSYELDMSNVNFESTTFNYELLLSSKVWFPKNITTLDRCFVNNPNVKEIHVPEGVTTISNISIYETRNGVDLYLPSTLLNPGEAISCVKKFFVNTTSSNVVFTDSDGKALYKAPATPGDRQTLVAFAGASLYTSYTIPANTRLQNYSFVSCYNISELIVSDNVVGFDNYKAFQYTTNIEVLEFMASAPTLTKAGEQFANTSIGDNSYKTKGVKNKIYVPKGCTSAYENYVKKLTDTGKWELVERN